MSVSSQLPNISDLREGSWGGSRVQQMLVAAKGLLPQIISPHLSLTSLIHNSLSNYSSMHIPLLFISHLYHYFSLPISLLLTSHLLSTSAHSAKDSAAAVVIGIGGAIVTAVQFARDKVTGGIAGAGGGGGDTIHLPSAQVSRIVVRGNIRRGEEGGHTNQMRVDAQPKKNPQVRPSLVTLSRQGERARHEIPNDERLTKEK
eukprot:763545-Hanusia_phi.AAC.1